MLRIDEMKASVSRRPQLHTSHNKHELWLCSVSRHPTAFLPGAAASQHSLVPDQRHLAGRGALPGLPVPPAGLGGVSPVHEPRGRGAGLPHPPEAGRVWDLHDQHSG